MELLERVNKIELNDNNKYFLEEVNNDYKKYIDEIMSFDPKLLKNFLTTIKQAEILNNQQAEQESSLLISLYINMHRVNSLNKIIQIYKEKENLDKHDILLIHKVLMTGTESDNKNYKFRQTDTKFVGAFNSDGTKRIDYMPIDHSKINENIEKILEFLNNNNIDNVFINPFIVHGIISVMQPFDDGNTRLSRLIQHAKIWKNTNHLYSTQFEFPTLYLSKNYLLTRGHYRDLITNLAIEKNNNAWNKWFEYNLNMVNEQLYYLNNNVKKLKMNSSTLY